MTEGSMVAIGTKRAVAMAVKRTESQKRITTLRRRLVERSQHLVDQDRLR
jgi:hypothetical protein